jgi:hypothetical protein
MPSHKKKVLYYLSETYLVLPRGYEEGPRPRPRLDCKQRYAMCLTPCNTCFKHICLQLQVECSAGEVIFRRNDLKRHDTTRQLGLCRERRVKIRKIGC